MSRKNGFIFAVSIKDDRLVFSFLRFIPVNRIKFEDIEYLRISSMNEYFESLKSGEVARYWPSFINGYAKRLAPIYVIKVRESDEKVFVRLSSSFHYLLRTAIGKVKTRQNGVYHPSW